MNLFDLNTNTTTINIDGIDIEMIPAMCHGKEYDKWLVSECGKVWSLKKNKVLSGHKSYVYNKNSKTIQCIMYSIMMDEENWWKPLYDNPPVGIVWEEWEIVRRDLPSVYNHISKTISIDHIDDDPTNNHIDNLRRVTTWDNQVTRKAKGI